MTIILTGSSPFIPQTSRLHDSFSSVALPAVNKNQKERADNLSKIKMPVIGKKNRFYGMLELGRIFEELVKWGIDVEIAGSTVYHIGGKELADDTAKLIEQEPFSYRASPIRDIDIRVIVSELNQYDAFVQFLKSLFPRIAEDEIINDLLLASHSDSESISFTFGDKNSVTCDILVSFKPSRLHLFYRDAIRYSMKGNKFISDLESPLQAPVDHYRNVVQTDNPKGVNKKGWPKLIALKAKGADIPDRELEGELFDNVVESKKRKELIPEIIDLLTKAAEKAGLAYSDLLFEASLILEKKLSPENFQKLWDNATGTASYHMKLGVPFHVAHAYHHFIRGLPPLECLFTTPNKEKLDPLLEDKLAPYLFTRKNPRSCWQAIKSKELAEAVLPQMIEKDPLLALETATEFGLPATKGLFTALLDRGLAVEANALYDTVGDESRLDELTMSLPPTRALYDEYTRRTEGTISPNVAAFFIETLPIRDLIALSNSLKPYDPAAFEQKTGPELIKKQIANPTSKEWRKLIDYAEPADIESWFNALLEKVSVNEARLFCLHEKVTSHPKLAELVKALAQKADLSQRSLFWDILDLCLSHNAREAGRLIELARGNTSGLPRPVLKKIVEKRDALLEAMDNPFPLAECLCDLSIEPVSLADKIVSHKFASPRLLKAGWLGKNPFDLETSRYFIEHSQFESFYPLLSTRLHPDTPLAEVINRAIEEKKYRLTADLANPERAPAILSKLSGINTKERVELLKKYGADEDWEAYLNEPGKKGEDVYSHLLAKTGSSKIRLICFSRSENLWEPYLDNHPATQEEQVIVFKRAFDAKKAYTLLKPLKDKIGEMEASLEIAWQTRSFTEEPYSLERTLAAPATRANIQLLISKIYAARPPKDDYARLKTWMKEVPAEIMLYFDPRKAVETLGELGPDMLLTERLFLRTLEIEAYPYLKEIYFLFNNDFKNKYRRAFLLAAIRDPHSCFYAIKEFKETGSNDKAFETRFVTELFSHVVSTDWEYFYTLWTSVDRIVVDNSKNRSPMLPPIEDLIRGIIRPAKDDKARVAEATHCCRLYLVAIRRALSLKLRGVAVEQALYERLVDLIPYHRLLTNDFDDAVFDFVGLVPVAKNNPEHSVRCGNLFNELHKNRYFDRYPTSVSSMKSLVDGCVISNAKTDVPAELRAREILENNFVVHIPGVLKAFKKLLSHDVEGSYGRAWHLLGNIQHLLIRHNQIESLIEFYRLALEHLPKYAFVPIKDDFLLFGLVKNFTIDLIGSSLFVPHPDTYQKIYHNLVPLCLDTLFESLNDCPQHLKKQFISDILSFILHYSNGEHKIIFDKLLNYIDRVIMIGFHHADASTIDMFTNGISPVFRDFMKDVMFAEEEKARLELCLKKYRATLLAMALLRTLNNFIINLNLSETPPNYIDNQV